MSEDTIKVFPYKRLGIISSPYDKDDRSIYHIYVNVMDLPEKIPTEVNPRDVSTKKKVYKKIVSGLTDGKENFFVNNRGILISAKEIMFDSKMIRLNVGQDNLNDRSLYGVLDGGHSYNAVLNHRDEILDTENQYVHLEVMTKVRNIDSLAEARNTSEQVSDKAIAELANKFKFVKDVIDKQPYANDISYRQNDDKEIDSLDLIRLMFMFNIFKYPNDSDKQPVKAYSVKGQLFDDFLNNYDKDFNCYKILAPLLPDIINLYDTIECEMSEGYKEVNPSGKFGKIKGITSKENLKTKFLKNDIQYKVTQGFIFPIISAFRSLIEENNGQLVWKVNPIRVWNKAKGKLVLNTIEKSRELGNNPQSTGKNSELWAKNFDEVNDKGNVVKLETVIEDMQRE